MNLVFRPVRPEDQSRVLEFTAHTWDDGDYISYVFDEWLADVQGRFTAVELAGQPIAIAKLTDLGEGELWLEGLRVDPAHRRQGIGQALHRYSLELARQLGGRVLRYATGENNTASHLLGQRTGFRLVGGYRRHAAEATADFAPPTPLIARDESLLIEWLDSPLLRSTQDLYTEFWKWSRLTETRLRAHVQAGRVFGLRSESGLRAWAIGAAEEAWDEVAVHHLDGIDHVSCVEMARAMRRFAADASKPQVETFALDPSPLIEALREAGYHAEEHKIVVFELML